MFSINAIFSQVQSSLLNNKTHFFVKLKGICPITLKNMAILKFQMGEVCILLNRFNPSSKGTCILSFYTILPNFIKIGQELFEIIDKNTHTHTHTLTHRHIHADENNTCPKSKILGQVIIDYCFGQSNPKTRVS